MFPQLNLKSFIKYAKKKSSQVLESENLSETKYTWKYNTLPVSSGHPNISLMTEFEFGDNCYKGRGRVGYTGISISSEVRSNLYIYHV